MKRALEAVLESDDDDEEPSLGRQTLPVANLPETFTGEPMDGLQYLFTVRRDAKKLPFITRAENPFKKQSAKVTVPEVVAGPSKPRVQLPSEEWRDVFIKRFRNFRKNSIQPTIGVAMPFLSAGNSKTTPEKKERDRWWDFIIGKPEYEWNPPRNKKPKSTKRDGTESARQRLQLNQLNHISRDDISQYEVPITENVVEDVDVRETLIVNEFGDIEDDQADKSGIAEEMDISGEECLGPLPTPLQTPQPDSPHGSSKGETGHRTGGPRHPTPALLRNMDSRYCVHLLMYFQHWLTQHLEHLESRSSSSSPFAHLSQNHARWMFALLSRVDEQLSSDELSTLRSLARACIAFIKDLNKNNLNLAMSERNVGEVVEGSSGVRWIGDPGEAPIDERACWMVVTIISDFWGQRDLWFDAENILNG